MKTLPNIVKCLQCNTILISNKFSKPVICNCSNETMVDTCSTGTLRVLSKNFDKIKIYSLKEIEDYIKLTETNSDD